MSVFSIVKLAFTRRFRSFSFWVLDNSDFSLLNTAGALASRLNPELELSYFAASATSRIKGALSAYVSVDYTAFLEHFCFVLVVHLEFGK